MKPDDKYYEKQTELETEKLKQKVNSLSQKDKQQIYEKGQIFHRSVACLSGKEN
jgi:hypothetical protein